MRENSNIFSLKSTLNVKYPGFVDLGGYPELGTFSLKELRKLKLPFGLKIERDNNWKSKPLWLVERAHMAMYELSV